MVCSFHKLKQNNLRKFTIFWKLCISPLFPIFRKKEQYFSEESLFPLYLTANNYGNFLRIMLWKSIYLFKDISFSHAIPIFILCVMASA